ncbi:hypothetical protein PROFUN_05062 [Planoprotostelium fungivorum]|uniref:Uncharacterized protein n=1 Tax=Planoprotostelium fungivorum TaxID=1890364 RepID=A0A2P6NSA9_9EUKA|nr:hypothetical protein PROFUN_05062 [Planoprotostelium fungivorum]
MPGHVTHDSSSFNTSNQHEVPAYHSACSDHGDLASGPFFGIWLYPAQSGKVPPSLRILFIAPGIFHTTEHRGYISSIFAPLQMLSSTCQRLFYSYRLTLEFSELPDHRHERHPILDDSGVCMNDGICRHIPSFVYKGLFDCRNDVFSDPKASQALLFYQILGLGGFGLLFLLTMFRFALEVFSRNPENIKNVTIHNITKISLLILAIFTFDQFLLAIDYSGLKGKVNSYAYFVLYILRDWIQIVLFSSILFHWVEMYSFTIRTIKNKEMISKINANFTPTFTVEELLSNVVFLSKFRIPFVVCSVLSLVVCIFSVSTYLKSSDWMLYNVSTYLVGSYFVAIWLGFTGAFIYVGVRLMRLMSGVLSRKAKKMTVQLSIVAFIFMIDKIFSLILLAVIVPRSKNIFNNILWGAVKNIICLFIATTIMVEIYVPINKLKDMFLLRSFRSTNSSNNKTNSNSDVAQEVQLSAAEDRDIQSSDDKT